MYYICSPERGMKAGRKRWQGVSLHNDVGTATCSFSFASWTQHCSSTHSLHLLCTRNKKPTWNPKAWPKKKKKKDRKEKKRKKTWAMLRVGPADIDMLIRELETAMASLLQGQILQNSWYCWWSFLILPPRICQIKKGETIAAHYSCQIKHGKIICITVRTSVDEASLFPVSLIGFPSVHLQNI